MIFFFKRGPYSRLVSHVFLKVIRKITHTHFLMSQKPTVHRRTSNESLLDHYLVVFICDFLLCNVVTTATCTRVILFTGFGRSPCYFRPTHDDRFRG